MSDAPQGPPEAGGEQQGGLQVPGRPEKHVFKAPAPRTSLLGAW